MGEREGRMREGWGKDEGGVLGGGVVFPPLWGWVGNCTIFGTVAHLPHSSPSPDSSCYIHLCPIGNGRCDANESRDAAIIGADCLSSFHLTDIPTVFLLWIGRLSCRINRILFQAQSDNKLNSHTELISYPKVESNHKHAGQIQTNFMFLKKEWFL